MASLLKTLSLFKKARDQPPTASGSGGALRGIKHVVIVPIPGDSTIETRSKLLDRLIKIIGEPDTSGPKQTGALIGLLSLFVESPGQLIQRIVDDPDISIKLVEVVPSDESKSGLTFASRGANLDAEADQYLGEDEYSSEEGAVQGWFENNEIRSVEVGDAEYFNIILASVLAQVWILLAKAVTAPDTAADSEMRRWVKYTQQRRVIGDFRMSRLWLDSVRNRIADDLSLRRFMVALILDIKRSPGTKPRIAEMICDIDNYIVEAGLASFILTIKFGIETMYPALGLHEFAGELTTIESLMILYQKMGETAPYMVILENSIQNKFSAGSYPLLWSYAMGVGVELENSMGGLNFGRTYFDPAYFRLGQEMVRRSAGKVSTSFAAELGISKEDAQLVSEIATRATDERVGRSTGVKQTQISFLHAEKPGKGIQSEDAIIAEGRPKKTRKKTSDRLSSDDIDDDVVGPTTSFDDGRRTDQDPDLDESSYDEKSAEAIAKMRLMTKLLGKTSPDTPTFRTYNDRELLN
ncbi:nucleocapsid protein [Porcine morbillivirus]|uniref:Nucleocapsid n=1 Tax=Porcine morbillivirus TaxID=2846955 RepID=A0A8F1NIT4_9MONO|nr:nucleocapsid protein [Porcine morbillivirus]